jgi:hypothetical protein
VTQSKWGLSICGAEDLADPVLVSLFIDSAGVLCVKRNGSDPGTHASFCARSGVSEQVKQLEPPPGGSGIRRK